MTRFGKTLRIAMFAAAVAAMGVPSAHAVPFTINFESLAATNTVGAYTSLIVSSGSFSATITRTSGTAFDIDNISAFGAPASFGARTLSPFFNVFVSNDSFLLNFSVPVLSFSIQFGDFGPSDSDSPVGLGAFTGPNGGGVNVANSVASWSGSDFFPASKTLSVSSPFAFESVKFSSAGSFPNSLYWDNISGDAVPEPGTLLLLGSGITSLALRRRRKSA